MSGGCKMEFPVGLRVLVVDDDVVCLTILDQMLRRCNYTVTTCSQATMALDLLRERRGYFDIVLSDVHMPDMDGFKLLELVGLEMDLPVIMMSGDGRTNLVMRGIQHGACDYLIKPIRDEELKNIWQHVVRRRKFSFSKEYELSGTCLGDNDRQKQASDEADYASSSVNEGSDVVLKSSQKKKRDAKEDDDDTELENDDPTSSKKPRVVWSVELHQQFVSAVNQLGIDKAVPKRILEMMNVPGLTRENVASHLQKFRLYLKRLSGVAQQKGAFPSSYCGEVEHNPKLSSLGRFDIQALAASGQIPPQTLAALQAELFGRPIGNLVSPAVDQGVAYGQPLMKCPSAIFKQFPQPIMSMGDVLSGFGSWPSKSMCMTSGSNLSGLGAPNGNMLTAMMQRPRQQQQDQQQKQYCLPDPNHSISVKPSCLVIPSESQGNLEAGNGPTASINQACNLSEDSVVNYGIMSPQSNNSSLGIGQVSDKELKLARGYNYLPNDGSLSPFVSSCSINTDNGGQQVHNLASTFVPPPDLASDISGVPVSYSTRSSQLLDQRSSRTPGFGKGASIPSRFAVDETESVMCNSSSEKYYGDDSMNKVKQEPTTSAMENVNFGVPIFQEFPPSDRMSVFSD